ncbi:ABC transporter ATP-binding protein [Methylomagnum ishizawai]|uniref:ABC transporter ATP-binding protein n=1 Tax=Methylomagnum ishizawai TaxID=1760988 RepID=UPI001C342A13|nr:ABC transporter ATP-binding protein [Methylomagnum ishizawai]BBL75793.1 ABC transporter ATP-binding protein [Methylomagnum ishizawai]
MALESLDSIAVRCRAVAKTYGRGDTAVPALRGIDLDIHAGELLMLVGPSGCGKTTLISIIAGILDPDAGECALFGRSLADLRGTRRVEFRGREVGFVFQSFNLIPTLTAAENVSVPLLINGVRESEALRRAALSLRDVGLEGREQALPSQLSGGQQQRVAIARALVHGPRLVVCDEPTSALDHRTGHKVMAMLKDLAVGQDRALVIVTHDARIFEFADRIAHMDDGCIERVEQRNG